MRGLAAVAAVVALAGCASSDAQNAQTAYGRCEQAVRAELDGPSTADFSGVDGSTMTATVIGYEVDGTVAGQRWHCQLDGSAGRWSLVRLDIG